MDILRGGRSHLSILLLLTYFLLGIVIILSVGFVNDFLLDVRSRVQKIAETAAAGIDGDKHEELVNPEQEGSELYQSIQNPLKEIVKINSEVQSIYTLRKTETPFLLKFVVDSEETEDVNSNGEIDPEEEKAHLGEEYDSAPYPELTDGFSRPAADKEVTCDKWGCWVSGYAPIINSAGKKVALLGVDVSADYFITIKSKVQEKMIWVFASALVLSLLFGGLGIALSRRERKNVVADRDLLSRIVEKSVDGMMVIDPNGSVSYINEAWQNMTGWETRELLKKDFKKVLKKVFTTAPVFNQVIKTIKAGKYADVDMKVKKKEGGDLYVNCVTMPLLINNESQGMVLVMRDVSEKKKAKDKQIELDKIRNEFIRIVSHQLRTPLNTIRWSLESLLAEELGTIKKGQKEYMNTAYDANVGVIRRINDMITAMDIEEGRATIKKSSISLDKLLKTVVGDWKKKKDALKRIRLSYKSPKKPLPMVEADEEKMVDVLEKVIHNAFSYTPNNGAVEIRITQEGKMIRVEIQDTGVGIPKKEQKKIFSRFFRASNAVKMMADGSGLGLFVCKHTVQAHGGTIGFKSILGKGSIFWIELPVMTV